MNRPTEVDAEATVDSIQERLTGYACGLTYDSLPPEVIHAARVRIIDALGGLIAGYDGEPCRIAREVAAQMPDPRGATVLGTRVRTTLELAAFANATSARYAAVSDSYHWPGSVHGHPSDTITPLLAVAEHARSSGRDFIASVVLAYEVFLRFCDVVKSDGFYSTTFASLAVALAGGKLLGLTRSQLGQCVSLAVVPNNVLKQVVTGKKSMFRAAAAGQAGRAGVFAALLARSGMEGPYLPFEGTAGWCDHVAGQRFALDPLGGKGAPFKILRTRIKNRASDGDLIACVLAAEKIAPLAIDRVQRITVEVYKYAKERAATGELAWDPDSRESADHSVPYVVAATLLDGTVTPRSYDDAHLRNPDLRALMRKIEVVENPEFTRAFESPAVEHRSRIAVMTTSGERLLGEAGGDQDDLSAPKSDAQIEEKFRGLADGFLGPKRVNAVLNRLWRLDELANVAEIPDYLEKA